MFNIGQVNKTSDKYIQSVQEINKYMKIINLSEWSGWARQRGYQNNKNNKFIITSQRKVMYYLFYRTYRMQNISCFAKTSDYLLIPRLNSNTNLYHINDLPSCGDSIRGEGGPLRFRNHQLPPAQRSCQIAIKRCELNVTKIHKLLPIQLVRNRNTGHCGHSQFRLIFCYTQHDSRIGFRAPLDINFLLFLYL